MKKLSRIKKHINLLKFLCTATKKQQKVLIGTLDKEGICCLSEICSNVKNGNVKLTKNEFARVKKLRGIIRGVADPRLNISRKRTILTQKGSGLLSILLPIVLSGLEAYLQK